MFLTRWFRRRRPRPDLHFTLFTRQNCCLCDDAWALLVQAQLRRGFHLEAKNVDDSAAWAAQYGDCVPVVVVNGKVRFRGKVNVVLLERILEAPP